MTLAVGIKFDPEGYPRYFKAIGLPLAENDFCVVRDPQNGREQVGFVACFEGYCACHWEKLMSIARLASEEEIERWHRVSRRQREALTIARGKVIDHDLPMKLISAHFNDEQNVVLFHFTADHRIDFRDLVRDLAGVFKARIELWQIGSRQGAAEKNGFGHCGRQLCCSVWMKSYPPISIRQARDQDINHSPPKLSGLCGRLRCCLRYEHETYCELRKGSTPVGATVRDPREQEGTVIDRNLLTGRALVQYDKTKTDWVPFGKLTLLSAGPAAEAKETGQREEIEEDEPITEYGENAD